MPRSFLQCIYVLYSWRVFQVSDQYYHWRVLGTFVGAMFSFILSVLLLTLPSIHNILYKLYCNFQKTVDIFYLEVSSVALQFTLDKVCSKQWYYDALLKIHFTTLLTFMEKLLVLWTLKKETLNQKMYSHISWDERTIRILAPQYFSGM